MKTRQKLNLSINVSNSVYYHVHIIILSTMFMLLLLIRVHNYAKRDLFRLLKTVELRLLNDQTSMSLCLCDSVV